MEITEIINYLKAFLVCEEYISYIHYGSIEDAAEQARFVIVRSNFFDDGVYATRATLPTLPLKFLPNLDIPFLFGESKIEKKNGKIILYADLIASAYFMLSRYEEIIKPECRDQHGRFLAKDSVVFQAGYGMRPLVDEWGRYLRNLLRECGVEIPEEKHGFSRIYLTHDVDEPLKLYKPIHIVKQIIKNLIHYGKTVPHVFRTYFFNSPVDPYYTFPRIIEYDNSLKENLSGSLVESIYFLIARGSCFTKDYCNIKLKKFRTLCTELKSSGAELGLHISYEAGLDSSLIKAEVKRLNKIINFSKKLKSRHHYLRWTEPEQIDDMEKSGITDDFTLGYADSVGFRVGTCRPYRFINPRSRQLTNVIIHPMEIMECSLDRENYMGLNYEDALLICKKLIDAVKEFNGELVLLWHNTTFCDGSYQEKLYKEILKYIVFLKDSIC